MFFFYTIIFSKILAFSGYSEIRVLNKVHVCMYAGDDLLITGQGDTKEEADKDHDANLVCLFQRCREGNIKLNKAKFDFKCSQVPFIGHLP